MSQVQTRKPQAAPAPERYCEDCRFVRWRYGAQAICHWPIRREQVGAPWVRRPRPVPIKEPCAEQRAAVSGCGPEGRHWQEKPVRHWELP